MPYTNVDRSTDHFRVKTYTGTGSSQSVTFNETPNMQPDFTWIKDRSNARDHQLVNAVVGYASGTLLSNTTDAEYTAFPRVDSRDSNGFTVSTPTQVNGNGETYVSWNWKANGAGSSNTQGSITSTVSANTTSGFSVGKTTGTLSSGTITVGHGLGVAPSMILWKRTDGTSNWQVYHKSTGTNLMQLNTTGAVVSGSYWGTMSSTTFTVSNSLYGSGETYAFYCFAEVKGFSKFSSFVGNGSTDGAFVYTGFKPAFVMIKASSTGGAGYNWGMWDNKRDGYNVNNNDLRANLSNAESTDDSIDLLSNGFKIRTDSGGFGGGSGVTYIYMAFAESPFVSSKGVCTTAR